MDPSQQVNAGHYRAEARRIRREAATVKDEAVRSQLLQVATTYERLEVGIEKQKVDAAHYRAAARRIRRAAATVKDETIRSQLLEIATTYEQLAAGSEKATLSQAVPCRFSRT
jgi:replicative DNA helicase